MGQAGAALAGAEAGEAGALEQLEFGEPAVPGALKIVDRRNLYEKLIQQYFATDRDNPGILKSWLLSGSPSISRETLR